MEWKDPRDIKNASVIIKTLLEMAVTDGDFDEKEVVYILKVGQNIGLDKTTLENIIRNRSTIEFNPPKSEQDRMSFLYYILFLIKVDQNISIEERQLLYKVGFKLGFNELLIKDLIQVLEDHIDRKLPPSALIEKVIKYLN
ncbi:MAG: TerB family tellurite resistance protein [Saprospiraceae bacterium]|nr:TerB family tellurite resistance protein [Saprospiraceae bacterium]